jgi:hypothetical protein
MITTRAWDFIAPFLPIGLMPARSRLEAAARAAKD